MNTTAKVFLVLLRVFIGWHFLYEGIFKIESDGAPQLYLTSRYFLQASTGRMRDSVANSLLQAGGQKPGLESALARIDQWNDDIVSHFKGQDNALADDQKDRLAHLRDELKRRVAAKFADPDFRLWLADSRKAAGEAPPPELRGELEALINIDWYLVHEEILKVASEQEGAHFTSLSYLEGSAGPFRGLFRGLAPDIEGVERLTKQSAQARLDQRYEEIVDHFRSRGQALDEEQTKALAAVRDDLKRSIGATLDDSGFQARVRGYRATLERVRREQARMDAPYSKERLDADQKKLDTIAGELLAFVNEPLTELTLQARKLATVNQMKAGPPPRPREQTELIDWLVKWGLTAIGLCLLLGLFSQVAAIAAAVQLALFYFASPPFPGLPAATMGGHYLYVDRNLIELVAVLALATLPTGRWAGLDSWLYLFVIEPWRRRRQPAAAAPQAPAGEAASGIPS